MFGPEFSILKTFFSHLLLFLPHDVFHLLFDDACTLSETMFMNSKCH